jgi:hypothetical protein
MTEYRQVTYDRDLDSDYYKMLLIRVPELLDWLDVQEPTEVEIEEDDWRAIGSAVAALRQSGTSCDPGDLERVEDWQRKIADTIDQGLTFTACNDAGGNDLEALRALKRSLETLQPVAEALEAQRESGAWWILVNPSHSQGPTVLTNNDAGVYDDPWDALADLAEAWREADNPDIYLSRVANAFPTTKRAMSDAQLVQADACFQYVCDVIRQRDVPPRHVLFGSTLARWFAGESVIVISSMPRSHKFDPDSSAFVVCRVLRSPSD